VKCCKECGDTFPLAFFYRKKGAADGHTSLCKACSIDRSRWAQIRHYYGLTKEMYLQMLTDQDGRCAICGVPDSEVRLQVDHCHETKVVRGLLCPNCNRGLGMFQDDKDRLIEAVMFLEGAGVHGQRRREIDSRLRQLKNPT
jgi:hypothetical protein